MIVVVVVVVLKQGPGLKLNPIAELVHTANKWIWFAYQ